jgi:hypothetical protein
MPQEVHLYRCLPNRLPHFMVVRLPHAQHLNCRFFDIKIKFIEIIFNKLNIIYWNIDAYAMVYQPFLAYIPINILLPNSVGFAALRVTEGDLPDFDVLIGMDIIVRGDFAISQSTGKTKFTFQMPSTHDFDFHKENYQETHTPVIAPKQPGRNAPCSCGSGKKFKHCCGKKS